MNNTRYTKFLAIFIIGSLLLGACSIGIGRRVRGSGNVVEETRAVSGVTGVNLATIGTLTIQAGDTESLRVEAEDNLMEYLETQVFGGTLRIGTQGNIRLDATRPVNYYLTVTGLETIEISSAGDIQAPDLKAERFSITITSSGNLQMGNLEAEALSVKISSSGNATMGVLNANTLEVDIGSSGNLDIEGGEVRTQNITISSSGNYTAPDVASEQAVARLTSSGSATIWVQDNLEANLNSSGDLRYRGDPTVKANTNSSGAVIRIGE